MCLSSVYVQEDEERRVIVEEASRVWVTAQGDVQIDSLFGEQKKLEGFSIVEVNFLKNYIVLEKVGGDLSGRVS